MDGRHVRLGSVAAAAGLALALGVGASAQTRNNVSIRDGYAKVPLQFEKNVGQTDKRVGFLSRGEGYGVYLTPTEAVLQLSRSSASTGQTRITPLQSAVIRMRLDGANRNATMTAGRRLPGHVNYFVGKDSAKWLTGVPTFANVRAAGVYPGIDMVYYGNQRKVQYDFVVAPGADPSQVKLAFSGVKSAKLARNGDLLLSTALGEVRKTKPVVYQTVNGARKSVDGSFKLAAARDGQVRVGFQIARYDTGRTLVIDPAVEYSTFLGGSGTDRAWASSVDPAGNHFVSGQTRSANFPVTGGAVQTTIGGGTDAFVMKLNAAGTSLLWSTFMGGTGYDVAWDISLDPFSYDLFACGTTSSLGFPTTAGVFQPAHSASVYDAWAAKFNTSTGALIYSTFVGAAGGDTFGNQAFAGSGGSLEVVGTTLSPSFPVSVGALQTSRSGASDAFVTLLNAAGSALSYSTYLGGSGDEDAWGVSGGGGRIYVAGRTSSTNFPTTAGCAQPTKAGGDEGFMAIVNPAGGGAADLVYGTYLGGTLSDVAYGVDIDTVADVYVGGSTSSSNFPVSAGAVQTTYGGSGDGFVTKISPDGAGAADVMFSTFVGGTGSDWINHIQAPIGITWVVGRTTSTNFPTTAATFQSMFQGGSADGFVTCINGPGNRWAYSTYYGGTGEDEVSHIFVETTGVFPKAFIAGNTASSTSFPLVTPLQGAYGGGTYDGFAAKLSTRPRVSEVWVTDTAGMLGETISLDAKLVRVSDFGALANRQLDFYVEGTWVGFAITGVTGVAAIPYTIPHATGVGVDEIKAVFAGDAAPNDRFGPSTGYGDLTVNPAPTQIEVDPNFCMIGDWIVLRGTLTATTDGAPVAGRVIGFTVAGITVSGTTDADGIALADYHVPEFVVPAFAGSDFYEQIQADFAGDTEYLASTGYGDLYSDRSWTGLYSPNRTGAIGDTIYLRGYLLRASDFAPLEARDIEFFDYDAVSLGTAATDANGRATLPYQIPELEPGAYEFQSGFWGDAWYEESWWYFNVQVVKASTTMYTVPKTAVKPASVQLKAMLRRLVGLVPLENKLVDFSVDGTYVGSGTTDVLGYAVYSHSTGAMTLGTHAVKAVFAGDSMYKSSQNTSTLNVTNAPPS